MTVLSIWQYLNRPPWSSSIQPVTLEVCTFSVRGTLEQVGLGASNIPADHQGMLVPRACVPTNAWGCTLHALQADSDVVRSMDSLNYLLTVSAQATGKAILSARSSSKVGQQDRSILLHAPAVGRRGVCCIFDNATSIIRFTSRESAAVPTHAWSCMLHALQADIDVVVLCDIPGIILSILEPPLSAWQCYPVAEILRLWTRSRDLARSC